MDLRGKLLSDCEVFLVSMLDDLVQERVYLFCNLILRSISVYDLKENSLFVFVTEHLEPSLQACCCLVKCDETIRQNRNTVVVLA